MRRRDLLKLAAVSGLSCFLKGRPASAAPTESEALWVHLQAFGGWDQALFCDPKPSVRMGLAAADREVRQAGQIPYLAFADFGKPADQGFFGRFHDRMLVLNGVDTGTNNHEIGIRYSACGSRNDNYPCLSAQVAAVYGQKQPLSFLDYSGYDQAADLLAPTRIQLGQGRLLSSLISPNNSGLGTFLPDATAALVGGAQRRRLLRQIGVSRLPGVRLSLEKLSDARAAQKDLGKLVVPPNTGTYAQLMDLGFSAYQQKLTTSIGLSLGGFDSHSDNDADQAARLRGLFDLAAYIMEEAERRGLPVVLVMSSDFGRTPYYTGNGTDHWPVSSVLVLLSRGAKAKGLALPTDQVVGGTTDGMSAQALRAVKIDPQTLKRDDGGIVITPGHLYRALRRVAKIDGAEVLRRFPLTVDRDLAIG